MTDACPSVSRQGERRTRVAQWVGMWGAHYGSSLVSALHRAADRTEHSSRSGPSRCTWCTSRPDLDAAPRPPSSPSSSLPLLGPCVGRVELKRPENSLRIAHEIDPGRAIANPRVCVCVCTGCARIIVGFFIPRSISIGSGKGGGEIIPRVFGDNIT